MADDPNINDPQNDPAPADDAANPADPAAQGADGAAPADDSAAQAAADAAMAGDVDSDDPVAIAEAAMRAAGMAVDDISTETNPTPEPPTPEVEVPAGSSPMAAQPFEMPDLSGAAPAIPEGPPGLDLLNDVNLHVKVELGRTRMYVDDVLRLGPDCIVELDKLAGDPVDIYVNEQLVARGEVLVVNESFCVRVSEIVRSPAQAAEDAARQSA